MDIDADIVSGQEEPVAEELVTDDSSLQTSSKKHGSSQLALFLDAMEKEGDPEGKIRLSIDFMRSALAQPGTPRFRDFWEGRKLCLPLFKENISAKTRSQFWQEYVELSSEARRLKEILDEQSAFAVEQIELAIQALERDLENYALLLSQIAHVDLPQESMVLMQKEPIYAGMQRELQFLNTLASRINGLRKEVMKTEMRIRTKNQLFERLSSCGDKVFPKRKELIQAVSQEFVQDVDQFIDSHFGKEASDRVPLFALREEIKMLQYAAKVLTLNTQTFNQTRLKLSGCWEQIKEKDKERKKEFAEKKQAFKQNFDAVMEKVKAFELLCQNEITVEEANRASGEILDFMQTLELGRDEVRSLRNEISRIRRPILDREKNIEQERIDQHKQNELKKREKINQVKDEVQALIAQSDSSDFEQLVIQRDALLLAFGELSISKAEKQIVERMFRQLKDLIDEKKERALLSLSDDDRKALDQLENLLEERKARRLEIKEQLEAYRKALGGSGFDFEKAMMYREMIEAEKVSLEKANASIDEIEDKIADIEG